MCIYMYLFILKKNVGTGVIKTCWSKIPRVDYRMNMPLMASAASHKSNKLFTWFYIYLLVCRYGKGPTSIYRIYTRAAVADGELLRDVDYVHGIRARSTVGYGCMRDQRANSAGARQRRQNTPPQQPRS